MPEMTQWEYRVKSLGGTWNRMKDEDFQAILNEWGEEGWEVISVTTPYSSNKYVVTARRPLSEIVRHARSMAGTY